MNDHKLLKSHNPERIDPDTRWTSTAGGQRVFGQVIERLSAGEMVLTTHGPPGSTRRWWVAGLSAVAAIILIGSAAMIRTLQDSDVASVEKCLTMVGPEPWLVLTQEAFGNDCLRVGVHQNLQIWNKGFGPISFSWLDDEILLQPDTRFQSGPLGNAFSPGIVDVGGSNTEWLPKLELIDPRLSRAANTKPTPTGWGPVELGMNLTEASSAFGSEISIDADLAPGPECFQAVIANDPYSPIFTVQQSADFGAVTIVAINPTYSELDLTIVGDPAGLELCP